MGPAFSVNDQSSVRMCGMGPAESTGKSLVSDCPGGSRLAMSGLLPSGKAARHHVSPRTSRIADNQPRADLLLEPFDVQAHRRLGEIHLTGRVGEPAGVADRDEGA